MLTICEGALLKIPPPGSGSPEEAGEGGAQGAEEEGEGGEEEEKGGTVDLDIDFSRR